MPTYCIIPHPNGQRVFMHWTEDGWTLPVLPYKAVRDVNRRIGELLGVQVTVLREVEFGVQDVIYVMANHSPIWRPPANGEWFAVNDVDLIQLAKPQHRDLLHHYFSTRRLFRHLPPWARPGWFEAAVRWIKQHQPIIVPIEQIHLRETGCVLEADDVVLKAVPDHLAHEIPVTQRLSDRFPDHIPAVLDIEAKKRWLLLAAAGDPLKDIRDVARWKTALRQFATLQIEATTVLDRLGVPDRRLAVLPTLYDDLVHDPTLRHGDYPEAIPPGELAAMRAFGSEVAALCEQLAAYHVPETLHHDDFQPANILFDGSRYWFVDWAEAFAAHPFYSLATFMRYAAIFLRTRFDDEALTELRDAYLSVWSDFEPMPRLIEAYGLAARLGKLVRALNRYAHNTESWLQMFMRGA